MTAAEPGRLSAGPATGLRPAVGLLCAVLVLTSCATGWRREGARLVHPAQGLSIRMPEGEGWQAVDVKGATLALRRSDGTTLSWLRRCTDDPPASARVASRALLRSLARPAVVSEGPVATPGALAWKIEARVHEGGLERRLEAVTRLEGGCIEDWVLVAPARVETAGLLDDWWPSVHAPQVAADGAEAR